MKKIIATKAAPAAIGPYSQAVQVDHMTFFSGQIPLNPDTGELITESIHAQTEQVMKNMQAALAGAGLEFRHVVKTTIYLTDMADFAVVNDIYGRFFPENPPARACVAVAALPKGCRIEIEWIASSRA
ncbi:RidA family protein [uncultured Desulfuromonas sp.]|uniref:RidA family protein n=1 Tax=uncultured Desulfuromonas sp. TaxID=181013 RepID=UPI002AAAD507|nr:RidA family protein [uncultured Desulfuromonas sp.]